MRFRRLVAAALAPIVALSFAFPAAAADSAQQSGLGERIAALVQKYGIHIRYDKKDDGKAVIDTRELAVLDLALHAVTPTVVKQVSDYYKKKTGMTLTYSFTYSALAIDNPDLEILGQFDNKNAVIELYLSIGGHSVSTGAGPMTVLHEFGHAYHEMVSALHGADTMKKEWTALNGSVSNNEGYMVFPYNKLAFISSYAASTYAEDFADTFAHVFARDKEGQGFYHRLTAGEKTTPIGKKVKYIESLLPKYLTGTETAVRNLRKIYTTPVFLNYQGLRLSGEQLAFIGCPAPRNVLRGLLSLYGIESDNTKWISDLGGWQVAANDGRYYVLFPGGACSALSHPLDIAA